MSAGFKEKIEKSRRFEIRRAIRPARPAVRLRPALWYHAPVWAARGAAESGTGAAVEASEIMGDESALAARGADDDRRLVERAQAGDVRAFEALVRRYERWVFTLTLRMLGDRAEAEDAAQEVFLKAYRGLAGFRGDSRFSTWLYAIASRHCLTALASRARAGARRDWFGRRGPAAGDDPSERLDRLADDAPRADQLLERRDLAALVQAELTKLPEDHRLILILRDIQGMAYTDIAQSLQIELGTVRSRLHRARMDLKARLRPHLVERGEA
jgi:RNA polymerase sigma-70 factor, ECF subfamily